MDRWLLIGQFWLCRVTLNIQCNFRKESFLENHISWHKRILNTKERERKKYETGRKKKQRRRLRGSKSLRSVRHRESRPLEVKSPKGKTKKPDAPQTKAAQKPKITKPTKVEKPLVSQKLETKMSDSTQQQEQSILRNRSVKMMFYSICGFFFFPNCSSFVSLINRKVIKAQLKVILIIVLMIGFSACRWLISLNSRATPLPETIL